MWLTVRCWYYRLAFSITNYIFPDRSAAPDSFALRQFKSWVRTDEERYWSAIPNRWHVQDLVVSKEWQGQGIGGMLMNEVVERAKNEGVVVGLEASPAGERLYRRLGFELLGRYSGRVEKEEEGGGVMILRAGSENKKGKDV